MTRSIAPTFVLGTMAFGDTVDEQGAAVILREAAELGIDTLDTANAYSSGESERILGRLLPGLGIEMRVASKVGMPHDDAINEAPLSARAVVRCVEGSLRRLGVERLDLLYLHQPDRSTPVRETLEAVGDLQRRGLVGDLGLSNFAAWQIAEVIDVASDAGCSVPMIAQQLYNLLARRIEDEYTEFAINKGIETVVYNPLAGGLLVDGRIEGQRGRYAQSSLAAMYRGRYWNEDMLTAIAHLQQLADENGMSLVELSARWLLSRPVVSSMLLGVSGPEQLRSNMTVLDAGPLPAEIAASAAQSTERLRGVMPFYNR